MKMLRCNETHYAGDELVEKGTLVPYGSEVVPMYYAVIEVDETPKRRPKAS